MYFKAMNRDERITIFEELGKWLFWSCGASGMSPEDARDIARTALVKLIEKAEEISAPNGLNSLKAWLETTAHREYVRIIAKEKRNLMVSLQEPVSAGEYDQEQTLEESESDLNSPSFEDLPVVREEEVNVVKEVLAEMPNRCQSKMHHGPHACQATCSLLWGRYGRDVQKTSLKTLSEEFEVPLGTMYSWYRTCSARFKELCQKRS
jgi:DNA-directed RNA polymerase specialized sigma24 family protein